MTYYPDFWDEYNERGSDETPAAPPEPEATLIMSHPTVSPKHARDWYLSPQLLITSQSKATYTDDLPRSRRTNICEIPDYKFVGGTIDKKSLESIDCPKCLVMIDGYLAVSDTFLRVVGFIEHVQQVQATRESESVLPPRRLVHGRDKT